MVKSRSRRHTIELVAWILFALLFFMNINSVMNGLGKFTDNGPQATQDIVSSIADAGDSVQDVAEEGILQSTISAVMGYVGGGSTTPDTVVVNAPTETGSGNIGEWIETIGGWFVGLWSFGTSTSQATEETGLAMELSSIVDNQEFKHLSRPVVTYVPLKDASHEDVRESEM